MKRSSESPGATHLIERQMLLSRVRNQASTLRNSPELPTRYRFITIARTVGSLGDEVASELARHLHWHVFDKEIVDFIAEDSHVRQDLVLELDERAQSLIHDTVKRLLLMAEGISFGSEEYHVALLKTLAYIAARGQAIIVGRGSSYALHGEPGLHFRVIASPDARIKRLAQKLHLTPDETRRHMQQVDAEQRSFIHHHFGQDVNDPGFFDAVFDTDRLSIEQIVHAVLEMITMESGACTPGASGKQATVGGGATGTKDPGGAILQGRI